MYRIDIHAMYLHCMGGLRPVLDEDSRGYDVGSFFDADLDGTFSSKDDAAAYLARHYRGVDGYGVGVSWADAIIED